VAFLQEAGKASGGTDRGIRGLVTPATEES
jgi:hypothetical protein